jgi:hypothetical protein
MWAFEMDRGVLFEPWLDGTRRLRYQTGWFAVSFTGSSLIAARFDRPSHSTILRSGHKINEVAPVKRTSNAKQGKKNPLPLPNTCSSSANSNR